mmetsp:Transcript_30864/g.99575  ORF Transcript_30864/g.99575 Transcript_30864/m.99575 type:complete len:213 (+) Transcript_30864:1362-2000(+)
MSARFSGLVSSTLVAARAATVSKTTEDDGTRAAAKARAVAASSSGVISGTLSSTLRDLKRSCWASWVVVAIAVTKATICWTLTPSFPFSRIRRVVASATAASSFSFAFAALPCSSLLSENDKAPKTAATSVKRWGLKSATCLAKASSSAARASRHLARSSFFAEVATLLSVAVKSFCSKSERRRGRTVAMASKTTKAPGTTRPLWTSTSLVV